MTNSWQPCIPLHRTTGQTHRTLSKGEVPVSGTKRYKASNPDSHCSPGKECSLSIPDYTVNFSYIKKKINYVLYQKLLLVIFKVRYKHSV